MCSPMFIAALCTVAKIWKQHKCPSTDEWTKKIWYTYTMEYFPTIKKEWNVAIWDNMDGPRGYYAQWNKSGGERQIPYDFTYMWNLKHKTNEHTKQNWNRLIDTENKLVITRSEGSVGWAK